MKSVVRWLNKVFIVFVLFFFYIFFLGISWLLYSAIKLFERPRHTGSYWNDPESQAEENNDPHSAY